MRLFKTVTIIICSMLFLHILSSCEKENEPDYESFLITGDSVHVPENIFAHEPFDILFVGTVGTNGCKQFYQFKTESQNNNITIEVCGKFDKNAKACPAVMVYLDGKNFNYTIGKPGNYTLKIKQTEDSYFEQQISVEQKRKPPAPNK